MKLTPELRESIEQQDKVARLYPIYARRHPPSNMQKIKNHYWSKDEIDLFYYGILQFGNNFTKIQRMFLPHIHVYSMKLRFELENAIILEQFDNEEQREKDSQIMKQKAKII